MAAVGEIIPGPDLSLSNGKLLQLLWLNQIKKTKKIFRERAGERKGEGESTMLALL